MVKTMLSGSPQNCSACDFRALKDAIMLRRPKPLAEHGAKTSRDLVLGAALIFPFAEAGH